MRSGQKTNFEKAYFNDGMTPMTKEGASYADKVAGIMSKFNSKTLKSKNIARASKKKRK